MPKKGTISVQQVKYETDKQKTPYWITLFYPEGAIENWKEHLEKMGIECSISPLHDKDQREDGTFKKPHYHIILCFNGNKTGLQVRLMMQSLLKDGYEAPMVQKAINVKGAEDYQDHSEEDNKYHYEEKPLHLNGFDVDKYQQTTQKRTQEEKEEEENNQFYEIMDIIEEQDITEIWKLAKYLKDNRPDLTTFLRKRTILVNSIINSKRNEEKSNLEAETMEIVKERNKLAKQEIEAMKKASFVPW